MSSWNGKNYVHDIEIHETVDSVSYDVLLPAASSCPTLSMWYDGFCPDRKFARMARCSVPVTSTGHESGTIREWTQNDRVARRPSRTISIRRHWPSDASSSFRPRVATLCSGRAVLRVGPNRSSRWTTSRAYVSGSRSSLLRYIPNDQKHLHHPLHLTLLGVKENTYRHQFALAVVVDVDVLEFLRFAQWIVAIAQATGPIHFAIGIPGFVVICAHHAAGVGLFGTIRDANAYAYIILRLAHQTSTAVNVFAWINCVK